MSTVVGLSDNTMDLFANATWAGNNTVYPSKTFVSCFTWLGNTYCSTYAPPVDVKTTYAYWSDYLGYYGPYAYQNTNQYYYFWALTMEFDIAPMNDNTYTTILSKASVTFNQPSSYALILPFNPTTTVGSSSSTESVSEGVTFSVSKTGPSVGVSFSQSQSFTVSIPDVSINVLTQGSSFYNMGGSSTWQLSFANSAATASTQIWFQVLFITTSVNPPWQVGTLWDTINVNYDVWNPTLIFGGYGVQQIGTNINIPVSFYTPVPPGGCNPYC